MKKIIFNEKEFAKLFPVTENSILAEKYKVAESTIRLWGAKLKLNKKSWLWSKKDEIFILENYYKISCKDIAAIINRSVFSVQNKFRELSGKTKKKITTKINKKSKSK